MRHLLGFFKVQGKTSRGNGTVPSSSATLLLVEGRGSGSQSLTNALQKAGYRLAVCHTGKMAVDWSKLNRPDLVVFDAASMRSNGSRSCLRLRRTLGDDVPIIHTRLSGQPEDHLAGADVYLVHPFTPRKLLNRIRSLLPADDCHEEVVRYGRLTLYPSKPSVEVNGQGEKPLTPKLMQLLQEFIRHPNEVVSRRQLMQNVWKTDYIGDTRTLDVHIRWVRELIEENPAKPQLLLTVRGQGYCLNMPTDSLS
jgi:two-component system phosphate regulon response regulator PhoB